MSASRVSCATRCERSRISLASRRASARAASRSASALSRSRRACSASRRPCSIRARRSASILLTGPSAKTYSSTRNRMKLSDETITQNRLISRPAPPWVSAASCGRPAEVAPLATAKRSIRDRLRLADEEDEDADHDCQDPEPFCETGQDDRKTPDLGSRVRIPPDRRAGQPGQDADADAGPDDAEGCETCAEAVHTFVPPCAGAGARYLRVNSAGSGRLLRAGLRAGERRPDVAFGHIGELRRGVSLLLVALDRDECEHEGERGEDERLDEVEQELQPEHGDRNDRDRQGREDAQRNLPAQDVAEESHRQRDRLDQLEKELDQTDKQVEQPGAEALP